MADNPVRSAVERPGHAVEPRLLWRPSDDSNPAPQSRLGVVQPARAAVTVVPQRVAAFRCAAISTGGIGITVGQNGNASALRPRAPRVVLSLRRHPGVRASAGESCFARALSAPPTQCGRRGGAGGRCVPVGDRSPQCVRDPVTATAVHP